MFLFFFLKKSSPSPPDMTTGQSVISKVLLSACLQIHSLEEGLGFLSLFLACFAKALLGMVGYHWMDLNLAG